MSGDPDIQCGGRRVSTAPTLSILIPVRNEGINLKIMLKILSAIVEVSHEVLVTYDSLGDDSIGVVEKVREDYEDACNLLVASTPDESARDVEMRRLLEAFTDLYEAALAATADAPPEVTETMVSAGLNVELEPNLKASAWVLEKDIRKILRAALSARKEGE